MNKSLALVVALAAMALARVNLPAGDRPSAADVDYMAGRGHVGDRLMMGLYVRTTTWQSRDWGVVKVATDADGRTWVALPNGRWYRW